MNIHLGSRERASVLVMCIFCTLIIVSGLIVCRYLQKWAKRIDTGETVPVPGFNSNDVIVPNPSNPNITGGRFEDYHRNYMWYVPTNAGALVAEQRPTFENVIYVSMMETNAVLKIERRLQTSSNRISDASLGVPVDGYGIPTSFSWSVGFVPSGGESWLVQKTTNFSDWIEVQRVTIPQGYTNAVFDTDASETLYYRATKQ